MESAPIALPTVATFIFPLSYHWCYLQFFLVFCFFFFAFGLFAKLYFFALTLIIVTTSVAFTQSHSVTRYLISFIIVWYHAKDWGYKCKLRYMASEQWILSRDEWKQNLNHNTIIHQKWFTNCDNCYDENKQGFKIESSRM